MTLAFGQTVLLLPPSSIRRRALPFSNPGRAWKHRRLKLPTFRSEFNPTPSPLDNVFHDLLSQLPSLSTVDLIAPAVGFAAGAAVFFSSRTPKLLPNPKPVRNSSSDIGEWILFTSPTPFNRFVTLRCPSIEFPENELMENVSEKLVKEDRHYVKLNSGRMIQPVKSSDGSDDEKLVYQRLCIGTDDGGVLSLDWPSNLDLHEERGFDTTVLIVPGTADGSSERKVRAFVCDCLRRGVLPLVMNPRGCAASPLTTPRLFTAADSDDVSVAVQYITKKRPWTTLMAVGWEYGANMLTKYLAEFGERTPLTAAICIDNPFDLEEATRSSLYQPDFDQRQTDGLIKILQSNKKLFQGRGKGFDVERALSASSVRDFERAISMVSYGFDTIEDFYEKSSTRDVIEKVKVPVLFIQNDDGKTPLFSIPRSLIAENPYTSLLLCSYKPSSKIMINKSAFSWCQHLTLEWLSAVELGLLKGRHPLLNDIDVSINPSKGLVLLEGKASPKRGRDGGLLKLTNGAATTPRSEMFQVNDKATKTQLGSKKDAGEMHIKESHLEDKDIEKQPDAAVDPTTEGDIERGQVLQSAEVILNMLDVTVPETLSDEQKKKVLNAVGKGETLIKALQDAVPDDVRGTLTTAVSGILQSHGSDLKFDKILKFGKNSEGAPRYNSKVLDKDSLTKANRDEDFQSLEQKKKTNGSEDGNSSVSPSPDMPSTDMESEKQAPKILQKQSDPSPDLLNGSNNELGNSDDNAQTSGGTVDISGGEIVAEVTAKQDSADKGQMEPTNENNEQKDSFSNDHGNISEPSNTEENSSTPSPTEAQVVDIIAENNQGKEQKDAENNQGKDEKDAQSIQGKGEKDAQNNQGKDEKDAQNNQGKEENNAENNQGKEEKDPASVLGQNMSDSSSFSVSQAFNALTGFDDSTQLAVNNVFNVIEGMIDQLEEKKEDTVDEMKNTTDISEVNAEEVKDFSEGSGSKNRLPQDGAVTSGGIDVNGNAAGDSGGTTLQDTEGSGDKYEETDINNLRSQVETKRVISSMPVSGELPNKNLLKYLNGSSENIPSCPTNISNGGPLCKECLKTYLSLKRKNAKPLSMSKPSALHLDYIPEEGKWKLLEQTENDIASFDENASSGIQTEYKTDGPSRSKNSDNTIEPSYVILDSDQSEEPNEGLEKVAVSNNAEFDETESDGSTPLIKSLILECLKVEVGRRVSATDVDDLELKLAKEMEYVSNAVAMVPGKGKHHMSNGNENMPEKLGILDGENVVRAISSAVQDTEYLRTVLPVGVIVGSSLAALRKFFDVAAMNGDDEQNLALDLIDKPTESPLVVGEKESSQRPSRERQNKDKVAGITDGEEDDNGLGNSQVIMGAVTAALGASAMLAHQHSGPSNESQDEKENSKGSFKPDGLPEKTQNNIVMSLAEKAMSVASPVVPMKGDGEVDHERIVSMLAELGQRGGMLRLIGKLGLLWGGLRGAMSLIEKLISFLRIAERPLFQRIPGFVFMVLLLWSPVVLPLLPSLLQSWATNNPFKIAEFACIAGLYMSTMVMITVWGKRVRKYDDPLLQYGFDLASLPKLQNFLKGLVGGAVLVTLIHTVNASLGCGHLHWPTTLSLLSSDPVPLMKAYGQMLLLILKGITTASVVAVVEELLFRSWLPQEIAVDFGYHRGVFFSGLLFALSQRSVWEIPGLWLLSISLSGARQRSQGSLSLPIGLRTGILASNFILRTGGFLAYEPSFPLWVAGVRPFKPFSGVIGLAFSSVLIAIFLSKQLLLHKERRNRVIRD